MWSQWEALQLHAVYKKPYFLLQYNITVLSYICLTHANVWSQWEALQLHAVYKKPYFLLQVTQESVSVLQVTLESVSGIVSHTRCV